MSSNISQEPAVSILGVEDAGYAVCSKFLVPIPRPIFMHGPPGPRPRAANFQGRHIKKIEIEVW